MTNFLRHLLATIAYRFQTSIKHANESFVSLQVDQGVRPPVELLHHMVMVLEYGKTMLTKQEMVKDDLSNWVEQVALFHIKLTELDNLLQETEPDETIALKLVQGPLTDVLTHIGQLAMLSRMDGSPIEGESFIAADIKIGRVGLNQNLAKNVEN